MSRLRTYEAVLLGLLGLSLLVAIVAATNQWVALFAPNAATEIFGILITVVLVERALTRERRSERDQQTSIALARVGNRLKRIARELRRIGDRAAQAYQTSAERLAADPASRAARKELIDHLRSPTGQATLAAVREEMAGVEEVVNNFPDLPETYAISLVHAVDSLDHLCDYLRSTEAGGDGDDLMRVAYSLHALVRHVCSLAEETRELGDSAAARIAESQLVTADDALLPLFVQQWPVEGEGFGPDP